MWLFFSMNGGYKDIGGFCVCFFISIVIFKKLLLEQGYISIFIFVSMIF